MFVKTSANWQDDGGGDNIITIFNLTDETWTVLPSSPYYNDIGILPKELLPQQNFTREATKYFFEDKYGFNTREAIAIMGMSCVYLN